MKKEIIILAFALLLIAPFASAEILISQPASAYNYGDAMNVTITLVPQAVTNDYLSVKLACDGKEAEIHRAVYELGANEQRIVYLTAKLDSTIISDIVGNCFIKATYAGEEKDSQYFIITKNIDVVATIDGSYIEPGNEFGVSGRATKTNGQLLNGFVDISSPELNVATSGVVSNGNFRLNLTVPKNAMAGNYEITVRAYEKDSSGVVANEGSETIGLVVKQIVTSSDVALGAPSVKPGSDYNYGAVLNDQAGQTMEADATVSIYKPSGELFDKRIVTAGQTQTLSVGKNFEPGYWKIVVERGAVRSEKNFYVEELMDASFALVNGTLSITNTGNVPYSKDVEIAIGDTSEVKQLNIPVDGTKKFLLYAPNGDYEIKVKNEALNETLGSSYLTGNVIAIKEDGLVSASASTIFVWVFILVVVAGFVYVKYKKVEKKQYVGFRPSMTRMVNTNEKVQPMAKLAPFEKDEGIKAAVNEVNSGNGKQECTLVTIKIKNFDALKNSDGPAPDTINRIMGVAKSRRAKIQAQDPFRTAVFIPSMTKEQNNILAAVKFAKEAETMLNDHNRKYGQKIDFGIGVNKGEMFVEPYGADVNLTSIGNVSLLTRKLADLSESDVLLSGEAFKKTMSVVRAERVAEKGAYKLSNVVNRDANSGFINNFMKRQS